MSRLILQQAADLLAEYVEFGMCSTDPRVTRGINLAMERLMPRLNPEKTIARYQFDVVNNIITMPREVKTVLAASIAYPSCTPGSGSCSPGCCTSILSVKSRWYEMLTGGPVGFVPCAEKILMDMGTGYSTFADPSTANPMTIRCYADIPQVTSEGFLVINGVDVNGNTPIGYNNNIYIEGQLLNIPVTGVNYNDTPQQFVQINSITKPATQGRIRLYGVQTDGTQIPIAVYDPDEQNPDYRRYLLTWGGIPQQAILTVLAKRRWIQITSPYADLFITNIGALQNALMGMKYEKAGAFDQAAACWKTAFDLLDVEDKDYDNDYNATVQLQSTFAGGDIYNLR
jgi:hypothetical protein